MYTCMHAHVHKQSMSCKATHCAVRLWQIPGLISCAGVCSEIHLIERTECRCVGMESGQLPFEGSSMLTTSTLSK